MQLISLSSTITGEMYAQQLLSPFSYNFVIFEHAKLQNSIPGIVFIYGTGLLLLPEQSLHPATHINIVMIMYFFIFLLNSRNP